MPEYRAHIVMGNGQNDKVINLDCTDDVGALTAAERFVDGHDVEVWRDFQKLGVLHRHAEKPSNVTAIRKTQKLPRRK